MVAIRQLHRTDPGTYDVRVRMCLCQPAIKYLTEALVLTGPAVLNAIVTETDIICYDAANVQ